MSDAGTAISASKNAVENNALGAQDGGSMAGFWGIHPDTGAAYDGVMNGLVTGYLTQEEANQIIDDINTGKSMHDPVREDLKNLPENLAIMLTPYGTYVAFRDADSWGDYAIATASIIPEVGVAAKFIRVGETVYKVETKAAQTLVKDAEAAYKAGNVAEGNRLMNQVASKSTTFETTVVKDSTLKGRTPSNPSTMSGLNSDLISKGFQLKGTSGGGYTTYKHPDGRIVTIKPTGEVIATKPKI